MVDFGMFVSKRKIIVHMFEPVFLEPVYSILSVRNRRSKAQSMMRKWPFVILMIISRLSDCDFDELNPRQCESTLQKY